MKYQKDILAETGSYDTSIEYLSTIPYKTIARKYPSKVIDPETLQQEILDSHNKFTNPYEYAECAICGYRAAEIPNHVVKHGITCDDYKKKFNTGTKSQKSSDRVKGANNPGYQHGGKFSPFSKKFVAYEGIDNVDEVISNIREKRDQTATDNPQNQSTRIEYWIARGYSEEDANRMLSERQSTFSKEQCIEKYGHDEGMRIWKDRQYRWIKAYNDKTPEEMEAINRKKAGGIRYRDVVKNGEYIDGWLYIIEIEPGLVKIGITSQGTVARRYTVGAVQGKRSHIVKMKHLLESYKAEVVLKALFSKSTISQNEALKEFGWTEVFRIDYERGIKAMNMLIDDVEAMNGVFSKIYTGEQRKDIIDG